MQSKDPKIKRKRKRGIPATCPSRDGRVDFIYLAVYAEHMISIETLRHLLSYDPQSGVLTWRLASPDMFSDGDRHSAATRCAIWNAKSPGKVALNHKDKNRPYRYGDIFGKKHYAHRVAFAIMTGTWPDAVDHIDGNKENNKWNNLRQVSHSENMKNCRRRSDNKSGQVGVYFDKSRGKWAAEVFSGGVRRFLGRFDIYDDAVRARTKAQEKMGFAPRHGS